MSNLPALNFPQFNRLTFDQQMSYLDKLEHYQNLALRQHLMTASCDMTHQELEQHLQTIQDYYKVVNTLEGQMIL